MNKKYIKLLVILVVITLSIIVSVFIINNSKENKEIKNINGNENYNMTSYNCNFISYGEWIIYSTGTNALYSSSSLEGVYKYNKSTGQTIKLSDYNRLLF